MDVHDPLTEKIIGCAIEVHRQLGPGLMESSYEEAMCIELRATVIPFARQVAVPVIYKGELVGQHRPDLVVADRVVVEIKAVERLHPVHKAQVLAYMRVLKMPVGLLINFNTAV